MGTRTPLPPKKTAKQILDGVQLIFNLYDLFNFNLFLMNLLKLERYLPSL